MQHLVVQTSKPDKLDSPDWVTNGVGRRVSHKFGYGLLDAEALVNMAKVWESVPKQHICWERPQVLHRFVKQNLKGWGFSLG